MRDKTNINIKEKFLKICLRYKFLNFKEQK